MRFVRRQRGSFACHPGSCGGVAARGGDRGLIRVFPGGRILGAAAAGAAATERGECLFLASLLRSRVRIVYHGCVVVLKTSACNRIARTARSCRSPESVAAYCLVLRLSPIADRRRHKVGQPERLLRRDR